MAGVVKRADVKEDKDGKSRGMGTVTFDQPLEAVQAICILPIYILKSTRCLNVHILYKWSLLNNPPSYVEWTDTL